MIQRQIWTSENGLQWNKEDHKPSSINEFHPEESFGITDLIYFINLLHK